MGEFSAGWLALREPADVRARSAALASLVADRLAHAAPLRVLDLAAGTGANARYLDEFLSRGHGGQRRPQWLLLDHDSALLAVAAAALSSSDRIETRALDLAFAFNQPDNDLCAGRDLVTASALLDLVSEPWLRALASTCRGARAAVLFALTYNGDVRCTPREPEDDAVRELVNRHQRIDKGFGPALGPDAAGAAARAFAALGYEVRRERSDWVLETDARDLQTQLIEGWAEAAAAVASGQSATVHDWKASRLAHVAAGRSRIIVGHEDLAGWL
jgi:hypothetical protein